MPSNTLVTLGPSEGHEGGVAVHSFNLTTEPVSLLLLPVREFT